MRTGFTLKPPGDNVSPDSGSRVRQAKRRLIKGVNAHILATKIAGGFLAPCSI